MDLEQALSRAEQAVAGEPEHHRVVVLARVRRYWPDLVDGLQGAYGDEAPPVAARVLDLVLAGSLARPADLRLLDLRRHVEPDWFQQPGMLGYAAYADRFADDLAGVAARVPYLAELGVTWLHLLPLLRSRPGPDDGGYAVTDFGAVRPDLGTMADLSELARTLRGSGISLTLDLVLNHVAAEHGWARRAAAGEPAYRDYFHVYPDRGEPDAFERSLPEVFPDFAPGSFSWVAELDGWVWTTFNTWQWDLNWHNPQVLCEYVSIVCALANAGVECLRLDAIAFLWKRLGTDCQNQPEVHALTQALRAAARIAAPALLFLAEAIVGPAQLAPYLGTGRHTGRVSDLAYDNSLMVQVWSSLATRDVRLLHAALQRPAKPTTTSWATYLRCHDDIGWAIDDADAAAVGWDGPAHRAFLSDYYSGAFPGSPARGLVFQQNPATGDRRISGMAASLNGLSEVAGSAASADLAVRRHLLGHLIALGFGGLPLLWMGDELALLNDEAWAQDLRHAGDNRWVHRPRMPWALAERRHEPGTVEHRVWHALRRAARARAASPALHAAVESVLLEPVDPAVLALVREAPTQTMVGLYNLSEHGHAWPRAAVPLPGTLSDGLAQLELGTPVAGDGHGDLRLGPYQAVWLTSSAG